MTAKKKKSKRWEPTVGAALGPQERVMLARLERLKTPVMSSILFRLATGVTLDDKRLMQQRVGAVISRLNKKLRGRRIVAGDLPHTYRLRRVR